MSKEQEIVRKQLEHFLKAPVPAAMTSLLRPWVINSDIAGTHIEFFIRAYVEAKDILDRDDSLVAESFFDHNQALDLLKTADVLSQIRADSEITSSQEEKLKKGLSALRAVSQYHRRKVERSIEEYQTLEKRRRELKVSFAAALAAGDTEKLVAFYPHLADRLDRSPVPEARHEGVADLNVVFAEKTRIDAAASAIEEALEYTHDNDAGMYSLSFTQMLGPPDELYDIRRFQSSLIRDEERNRKVLMALLTVAGQLERAMNPSPFFVMKPLDLPPAFDPFK